MPSCATASLAGARSGRAGRCGLCTPATSTPSRSVPRCVDAASRRPEACRGWTGCSRSGMRRSAGPRRLAARAGERVGGTRGGWCVRHLSRIRDVIAHNVLRPSIGAMMVWPNHRMPTGRQQTPTAGAARDAGAKRPREGEARTGAPGLNCPAKSSLCIPTQIFANTIGKPYSDPVMESPP